MNYRIIASTYGESNYNSDVYNGSTSTGGNTGGSNGGGTTTGTVASGGNGGGSVLANTGFEIVLAVTLASAIIFTAMLVRFVKRKPVPQEVSAE